MDPLTQGALGAAVAEAVVGERAGRRTWLLGAASGMAADLDVLVRSADPLVEIVFHRHFTHSLAFVPLGGLLCALPFLLFERDRARWRWIVLACVVGYATHAPLDCGTSYGTLYFWPFSDARVALDVLPIVDLFYTVPLLVGLIVYRRRRDRRFLYGGLALAHLYAALCTVQHFRARGVQEALYLERGWSPEAPKALPFIFTNTLWRAAALRTATDGRRVVASDLVVVPWFGEPSVIDGVEVPVLEDEVPPGWPDDEASREAVRVMRWFSQGYVGMVPALGPGGASPPAGSRALLCDLRLSIDVVKTKPVICVGRSDEGLVRGMLGRDASVGDLFSSIFQRDPRQRPVKPAGP